MTQRDQRFGGGSAHAAGPPSVKEVAERAADLDITPKRLLQELARMGFASLRDIVDWDEKGIKVKPSANLSDDQVAAIAEIVASASTGKIYRIKMHDKNAPLVTLGRAIGMFRPGGNAGEETDDDGEDPREFLIRELARLRARRVGGGAAPSDPQGEGAETQASLGIPGTR
jgi:hypothetical protein